MSGSTWGNVIPSPKTWAEIGIATKKWFEIFQLPEAGILKAKLKWGPVSGQLTNELDYMEIIASEVEARYVQFEITITDPSSGGGLYLYELNMKAAYWQ